MNTQGLLCDAYGTILATNDDWNGTSNQNCAIWYWLTADTSYYVGISAYGNATGSYTFIVDQDQGDTKLTAASVMVNSQTMGSIGVCGDVDYYEFVPSVTDTYYFYTSGALDTYGVLMKNGGKNLAANDNWSSSNHNFYISYQLTAGQTYYIKVSGASYTDVGSYVLHVSN